MKIYSYKDPEFAERIKVLHIHYEAGLSLSQVAKIDGVLTRQRIFYFFNMLNLSTRQNKKLKTIEYKGALYTKSKNKGKYWRKTSGDRETLHRETWKQERGPIPDGYDVHHKDENPDNNYIENLECLSKSDHTRLYSPFNNQFIKGKKERTLIELRKCPECDEEILPIRSQKSPSAYKNIKTCSVECRTKYKSKQMKAIKKGIK